jgi:hypothetical protein
VFAIDQLRRYHPLRDVPAQLGMIDLTNIDPLLPDLADIPPLLPPAVLPPLKVHTKGRLHKDHTSTRRLPSAWERNARGPRYSGVSCNSMFDIKMILT